MRVQGSTSGVAAPCRLTTMRLDAHIMSPGLLFRIAQQRVVISGTSCSPSISGNNISSAGWPDRGPAVLRDQPAVAGAGIGLAFPQQVRPAMAILKPLLASQSSPASVLAQVRGPRSASCRARPWWSRLTRSVSRAPNCRFSSMSPLLIRGRCIGCMALVSTSTSKPRASASSIRPSICGFMNGSPPVKPISRVPSPRRRSRRSRRRPRPRDVDEPVVGGAQFDVAVPARDVAERAGVDPERLEPIERDPGATFARCGPVRMLEFPRCVLWLEIEVQAHLNLSPLPDQRIGASAEVPDAASFSRVFSRAPTCSRRPNEEVMAGGQGTEAANGGGGGGGCLGTEPRAPVGGGAGVQEGVGSGSRGRGGREGGGEGGPGLRFQPGGGGGAQRVRRGNVWWDRRGPHQDCPAARVEGQIPWSLRLGVVHRTPQARGQR